MEEAAAEKAAQNKRLELEAALEEAAEKAAQNKILKLEYALKKAVAEKAADKKATQKLKVIVLGTIGIGKSTMMNVLCGKDEIFKTSDAAEGCT